MTPKVHSWPILLRKTALVLLAVWAILSVGILAQFLYDSSLLTQSTEDRWMRSELEVKLTWQLLVLNFPLSFGTATIASSLLPAGVGGPIVEWCVLSLGGFLQWVLLVPALGRALLKRLWHRRDAHE